MDVPLDDVTQEERQAGARNAFPALPPDAPLAMPVQALHGDTPWARRLPGGPRLVGLRRACVILPAIGMTAGAAREMLHVLDSGGVTTLIVALLVMFVAL